MHAAAGSADLFSMCVAAAVLQMQSLESLPTTVLDQFAEHVFLPGLTASGDGFTEHHSELCRHLAALISHHQAHRLSLKLLSTCTASLGSCCEGSPSAASAAAAVGKALAASAGGGKGLEPRKGPTQESYKLRLSINGSCLLLQSLLSSASASAAAAPSHAQAFMALLLRQLLPVGLAMLTSSEAQAVTAAVRYVLPAVLVASKQAGALPDYEAICGLLWSSCTSMMSNPGVSRRAGLAAMVRFVPLWTTGSADTSSSSSSSNGARDAVSSSRQSDGADGLASAATRSFVADPAFWAVLQSCLTDAEPLSRKRAMHVLQRLPLPPVVQGQPGGGGGAASVWAAFQLLYDTFEDFAMYLVRSHWHVLTALHPVAAEHAGRKGSFFRASQGSILLRP